MIYKPEIKDITEYKEHFESYIYDAMDNLCEFVYHLQDIDIYECGEHYEDASSHIDTMVDELNAEIDKRIKELTEYKTKINEAKEDKDFQLRY